MPLLGMAFQFFDYRLRPLYKAMMPNKDKDEDDSSTSQQTTNQTRSHTSTRTQDGSVGDTPSKRMIRDPESRATSPPPPPKKSTTSPAPTTFYKYRVCRSANSVNIDGCQKIHKHTNDPHFLVYGFDLFSTH